MIRRKVMVVAASSIYMLAMVNMFQSSKQIMGVLDYNMQRDNLTIEGTRIIGDNSTRYIQLEHNLSVHQYRKRRNETFDSWFEPGSGILLENADKNGPILDFVISGFAKCGTTTMEANLGYVAPMPEIKDICTPVHNTVFYSYKNWPQEFGEEKVLRGSKCPQYIEGGFLEDYSKHLPRTTVIVGIRHPVSR